MVTLFMILDVIRKVIFLVVRKAIFLVIRKTLMVDLHFHLNFNHVIVSSKIDDIVFNFP